MLELTRVNLTIVKLVVLVWKILKVLWIFFIGVCESTDRNQTLLESYLVKRFLLVYLLGLWKWSFLLPCWWLYRCQWFLRIVLLVSVVENNFSENLFWIVKFTLSHCGINNSNNFQKLQRKRFSCGGRWARRITAQRFIPRIKKQRLGIEGDFSLYAAFEQIRCLSVCSFVCPSVWSSCLFVGLSYWTFIIRHCV